MCYASIEALITKEQVISGGEFIYGVDLEEYLKKLRSSAELITHYVEGRCVGFVAFYCNDPSKKRAFITLVLVSPQYRGQGVSKNLLFSVLNICRNRKFEVCGLEVLVRNSNAIKVYEAVGFSKVRENEGAIYMEINLE